MGPGVADSAAMVAHQFVHASDGSTDRPIDPIGSAMAECIAELIVNATVELHYTRRGVAVPGRAFDAEGAVIATASGDVVDGWTTTITVSFGDRAAARVDSVPQALLALPHAALRAASSFQPLPAVDRSLVSPSIRRALRDSIVIELLTHHQGWSEPECASSELIADTLEYLIELSGSRVEAHNLTHGVVITDALTDEPRLSVMYPSGLRDAKRSPLLFDGQRSVLVVDQHGRARTEFQAHRPDRLHPSSEPTPAIEREFVHSGSLVGRATQQLGGIGFFLREDRSIWTFLDGQPLVIRRGEHWSAFPLWLAEALGQEIGSSPAVDLIVRASLLVSIRSGGAIFAIVDDPDQVDDIVSPKDRYDRRDEFDHDAMLPETRLHHLIDGGDLDDQTLARLGALDGATVVDRDGRLIAYGAIINSVDSQYEGARTAAAKSLSLRALAVLKVSEDGDITVFRRGRPVATLLPSGLSRLGRDGSAPA